MIRRIDHNRMGRSRLGWLDSHFHFSFAQYHNPHNMRFGVLRVLNDDLVQSGTGIDTHPHENFEIISYVIGGQLTHADSMGHQKTLTRGQVQYMSAGTGVAHSEHNRGSEVLRFLQIWFFPDRQGHMPSYGDHPFPWEDRVNTWMPIASGDGDPRFPIQIHTDTHIYAVFLERGHELDFAVPPGRQAYLVLMEGTATINQQNLVQRDALEAVEEDLFIQAKEDAHLFLIEMAAG